MGVLGAQGRDLPPRAEAGLHGAARAVVAEPPPSPLPAADRPRPRRPRRLGDAGRAAPSTRPLGRAWGAAPPLLRARNREWVAVSGAESDLVYPDSTTRGKPSSCAVAQRGAAHVISAAHPSPMHHTYSTRHTPRRRKGDEQPRVAVAAPSAPEQLAAPGCGGSMQWGSH